MNWREKAHRLHEQHPEMSYAELGRRCGVTRSAVWKALNPERAAEWNRRSNAKRTAAKRAWAEENDRVPCPECGQKMGVGSSRKGNRLCGGCRRKRMREDRMERARFIEWAWKQGWSLALIAEDCGTSVNVLGVEMHWLRKERLADLPLRVRDGRGWRNAA